ncbi:hypothetical protein FKM82_003944 [Ascaphus truei]
MLTSSVLKGASSTMQKEQSTLINCHFFCLQRDRNQRRGSFTAEPCYFSAPWTSWFPTDFLVKLPVLPPCFKGDLNGHPIGHYNL